jgi:hypothetical protein|tara:strand:+ start:391 stop:525 length:135 start_codon:yes stop_codon:yes gene_type:complete
MKLYDGNYIKTDYTFYKKSIENEKKVEKQKKLKTNKFSRKKING